LTGISAYILLMLISDERLPCSCGGVLQQLSWKQHLIFNLFFLLLAVVGIVLESNPKKSIIH
jgi:phage shock protein PspC (stress-responsive transcriptional regulator)